ncbi:conserved hypothetical protein, partial [Stigmatella aurantiaca DW4/3-1]
MLVGAIPSVDDGAAHVARRQMGRPRGAVPDDEGHRAGGLDVAHGVQQCLALGDRRALRRPVEHLGAQRLGGHLERGAGPGGVLEEDVGHHPSLEDGGACRATRQVRFGPVEQRFDFLAPPA